jgi:hypothetical protein
MLIQFYNLILRKRSVKLGNLFFKCRKLKQKKFSKENIKFL